MKKIKVEPCSRCGGRYEKRAGLLVCVSCAYNMPIERHRNYGYSTPKHVPMDGSRKLPTTKDDE